MFLQGMRQVAAFIAASAQLIQHDLEQYPKTGPFPTRFYLANIPITLASYLAATMPINVSHGAQYAPTQLNVTQATPSALPTELVERPTARRTSTPRRNTGYRMCQPKDTQSPACFQSSAQ